MTDHQHTEDTNFDIAIIGMAGRFPGARNIDEFWNNLQQGKESIKFFTSEELIEAGVDTEVVHNPNYVKAAPIMDGYDMFDASFFGYAPREAQFMDPQHRLFLESSYQALEDAGYDPSRYKGRIGVFGGMAMNTYLLSTGHVTNFFKEYLPTLLGSDKDFLATRVSYKMNLTGPSVSVQTACSSSLVAIHMACQSLINEEADMTIVGGVAVKVPQLSGYLFKEQSVFSPDGHCRPFDAQAKGTIFGSGVGTVVLKRYADAISDGDTIHALIKGSAINNDGASKIDYTAPSVNSQSEAIVEAIGVAGISADEISYVEAHGTGTYLGDPIEIAALSKAFVQDTDKKEFCAVGSVKSNIGHLDAAAGVCGLIKTVLAMKHKTLPPSINYQNPNPEIDFKNSPFFVNDKLRAWETDGSPRIAGVTSLGMGGTNAHVILEEAPDLVKTSASGNAQLIVLSAKSKAALKEQALNLGKHLGNGQGESLADVAFTLQVGRKAFEHRAAVVCEDVSEAIEQLNEFDSINWLKSKQSPGKKNLAFMFSGQGSQYVNMARDLYKENAVFKEHFDECASLLKGMLNLDIRDIIYPSDNLKEASNKLRQTFLTQPALFAVEYSLAKVWYSWKVFPKALVGHSIGEYVAACLSGVFTLEQGLQIVTKRGRLMQDLPSGSMLSIPLPEKEVIELLGEKVSVSVKNTPTSTVVSGETEAIEALKNSLATKAVEGKLLHTSHAFHSVMMDPILEEFKNFMGGIDLKKPEIPFLSNVSGDWITDQQAMDPQYWADHIRSPVRFSENISVLATDSNWILLECGPGQVLASLAKQHPDRSQEQAVVSTTRHPKEEISDSKYLYRALGGLWLADYQIDWDQVYRNEVRRRISLPTYPFQRKKHWIQPEGQSFDSDKRKALSDWCYLPSWLRITGQLKAWEDLPDGTWMCFRTPGNSILENTLSSYCGDALLVGEVDTEKGTVKLGEVLLNPVDESTFPSLKNVLPDSPLNVVLEVGKNQKPGDPIYFNFLFQLAKWLGESWTESIHIWVITSSSCEVIGTEDAGLDHTLLTGPVRVINKEFPDISIRLLDLHFGQGQVNQQKERIFGEMIRDTADPIIAVRDKYSWVTAFEPITFSSHDSENLLKKGGVYVIVGGTSGLGMEIAKHLAQNYEGKLALVSRSKILPDDHWDSVLNNEESTSKQSEVYRGLKTLKNIGHEFITIQGDVTEPTSMADVFDAVTAKWGLVDGVIHSSGAIADNLISLRSLETTSQVITPKTKGANHLMQQVIVHKIPLLILFSSVNSYLAPAGQIDYVSANAYLDGFSTMHASDSGTKVLTINWPGWKEVGIFANMDEGSQKEALAANAIRNEEGIEVFDQVLNSAQDHSQIMVYPKDLNRVYQESLLPEVRQTEVTDEEDLEDIEGPRNPMEKSISDIWCKRMGMKRIDINDNYFDWGGNSLIGTQIVADINKFAKVNLSIKDMFSAPTVASLATLVDEKIGSSQGTAEKLAELLKKVQSSDD